MGACSSWSVESPCDILKRIRYANFQTLPRDFIGFVFRQ
jgi:hypothetical protein